jgi:hypothetical protein
LSKQAQLSSIEDIVITGNDIIYTGNYYGYVTELGESSSNSGGHLVLDTNVNLKVEKLLKLPKNLSGRKIIKLKEDTYLILANNGKSYIVNTDN